MPSRRPPRALVATVLLACFVPCALVAQQVDVIRGHVVGPDRQPVDGARVTVTSMSGDVNRAARTDRKGRYTVTFPGGDGDYFVTFSALGFVPRRYEVKRLADEDFLLADATLQRSASQLDSVRVTADRKRVSRQNAAAPDISGTERSVDNATVDPSQLGDLAAMAATQPGVTPVPGANGDLAGFSVLGLSPDQNQTTLNGLPFGASTLPRDAWLMASLVTSPYDVSTGGFSGARLNVRTQPGTNYVVRTASLFGTAPPLQWADRTARALGQQSTNISVSGLSSGPLAYDKAFYNIAYQLGHTASPVRTLLDPDPTALQATGLAADTVRRLAALLASQRVPLATSAFGGDRVANRGSLFATVDLAPPSSTSGQAVTLALNGTWDRQTPASLLTAEFPAHAGDRTNWNAGVQARHSSYLRNILLSETTVGVNGSRSYGTPYVDLPSGSVLVGSAFADGTSGIQAVAFGGSTSLQTTQSASSMGAMNQLSWFSVNDKHRLKLATELRRDSYMQDLTSNRLGTFTFNSLGDLTAGVPALYTRQLAPRLSGGSETVAALSLGDSYERTPRLQFQYGMRVDANHFASAPAGNPDVARTFGVPNTNAPSRVYVSPRAGFSWAYGTAPQVAGFQGAARGPRAVVRGGIGIFQDVPQAMLLGTAVDNTGLPTAVQQLTCVGPAVPAPDWVAYAVNPALIPTRCADGTAGSSAFANAAPDVTLFARAWQAPRALRSTLQWSGPVLGSRFSSTVEATYSHNTHQPSSVDLNFAGTPRFTLPDEGGRPVFVSVSSIVPTTGAVAWQGTRASPLFARVDEQRADLHSNSRQLTVSLAPTTFNPTFRWSLTYVYTDVSQQARGFASTAGDPRVIEWARGRFDTRHGITYGLNYNAFDAVRVSWTGVVRSGLPFTPLVSADINGDGYANDRAFVFDPAHVPDPGVGVAMHALLDGGSSATRACLTRQLGAIAGPNSCTGPWSHTGYLSFGFNPVKVRLPQRANLSFTLSNPLAAVDRLLHGDNGLRGWGQTAPPDPVLLYVRGFDPVVERFQYSVNPRFGATRPQLSAFRQPAVLTAMVRLDLGPSRERQALVQQLDRGRRRMGERVPEYALRAQYAQFGGGGVPNPFTQILRQADTLRLEGRQADSIATMNRRYVVQLDSIWSPVAKYMAALPADYRHDDAYAHYRTARRASIDLLLRLVPAVNTLLTAEQRRKLPPYIASVLDLRYLAAVRSGTAGVGSFFGG